MTSVTVLLCTSGRAKLLDRALEAIAAGSRKPDQVVIVNGLDGQTPKVVARHAGQLAELILLEHPNRNLATLRNVGLPYCRGDVIAMTDDDAIPDAEWLAAAVRKLEENARVSGVGGPVSGVADSFLSRLADAVVFPRPRAGQTILTLPTVNAAYRRSVVDGMGNFDETLFRGEDVDFNWRLIQAGHELAYEPLMRVGHTHRSSLLGFYQQQYMYGRAYVLVRTKWPEMYCVYPHTLRSPRSWAKLAYCCAAVVFQPIQAARSMERTGDRLRAYPVLVVHHLIWKLGMLRQAILRSRVPPLPPETVTETKWVSGALVSP